MKRKIIEIENFNIDIQISTHENDDYISLTDMARYKGPDTGLIISHWLTTKYAIHFMGIWEQLYNNNFNITEFRNIKNEIGTNGFVVSSSQWIKKTHAIGIRSSAGRYGGTYAHQDIAFEFATWLSPEFKLYLIKEYQRLKTEENQRLSLGWDAKRMLTKINYKIHTDSVKENIIIPAKLTILAANKIYANEADILNVALFGMTAQDWREKNKNVEGNMRDYANVHQLVCLANLEGINAELIRMGLHQKERLVKLNSTAIIQMKSLQGNKDIEKLMK